VAALAGWGAAQIFPTPQGVFLWIADGIVIGGAVILAYALSALAIRQQEMMTLVVAARPLLKRIGFA